MAEFTYETRRKISEELVERYKEKGKNLSEREKEMLPTAYYYSVSVDSTAWIGQLLEDGTCSSLSEIYKTKLGDLVDVCVPKELQGEFYYALDQMNQFQMTAG